MPPSPNDAFAALEQVAARQAAAEVALRALSLARTKLVLGRDAKSVFFATLCLRLKLEVDWGCPTMAVDGKNLFFNPEFVNGLSPDELVGVCSHEVMHLAMAHHARRMGRDPERWNRAADLSVNPLLLRAGFVLPPTRLMPGEGEYSELPPDRSAEEYYSLLPVPPEEEGDEVAEQGSTLDPGGCGGVRDPGDGSPADAADQEADWQAATAQAEAAARVRGVLPVGLARVVDQALRPPADWKAVLREFVSQQAKSDFAWTRPNRRFIAQGLYLPGMFSEELGDVVIAVDCSGSISKGQLDVFANELNAVLAAFNCTAVVVYHDSEVQKVDEFSSTDGPVTLEPVGGGGTSHVCIFDWLKKDGRCPACVVALTDLDTEFPPDPGVPVLWAVTGTATDAPFGRVVQLNP